jgi:predicted anti-sigma-YlaC factor YlaD
MHRVIQDHLEQVLAESQVQECDSHLRQCEECRIEVETMREQARLLRALKTDAEPRPGFYARVLERIEAQRPISIWNVFSDSPFGRRIAMASMALALLAGVYLVTSEQMGEQNLASAPTVQFLSDQLPGEGQAAVVARKSGLPDRDAVLVNLVTYREQ